MAEQGEVFNKNFFADFKVRIGVRFEWGAGTWGVGKWAHLCIMVEGM